MCSFEILPHWYHHVASGIQKSSPVGLGIVDCLERLSSYPLPHVVKTESEGNPGMNELLRNNDSMLIMWHDKIASNMHIIFVNLLVIHKPRRVSQFRSIRFFCSLEKPSLASTFVPMYPEKEERSPQATMYNQ